MSQGDVAAFESNDVHGLRQLNYALRSSIYLIICIHMYCLIQSMLQTAPMLLKLMSGLNLDFIRWVI